MKTHHFILILVVVAIQLCGQALAAGGEYAPVVQANAIFLSGESGKSITGSIEYALTFRAEKRKGVFRPTVAMDLGYCSGTASIGADAPGFTLMTAGFLGGVHIFPFSTGRLQPYIGGSGVVAWDFLKLPTPPTGIEPNTQGFAFGYELSAGVDLRFGNVEGNALRIHGSLITNSSTLAGVSGFQLNGFRLGIAMTY